MAKSNAIGWLDIYVTDMNRAVTFYESVLQRKLEPIGDPTGETQMMGFSTDMGGVWCWWCFGEIELCSFGRWRHLGVLQYAGLHE